MKRPNADNTKISSLKIRNSFESKTINSKDKFRWKPDNIFFTNTDQAGFEPAANLFKINFYTTVFNPTNDIL
jgi:hypothetical protein